ncbi:MAG: dephospho-CoA kinase [Bacteroidetes bacterium]|nr:dephospho-CoA kinase [Bacteroidota bacterium]
MFRVGLTGGIGSGKSTIAAIFEVLGVPVSYADREARRLMNEDPQLRAAIIEHFGPGSYTGQDGQPDPNGQLNRKYIGGQVFRDPARLALMNSLVHPATIRDGRAWMHALEGRYPYAIREAAIIFETSAAAHLDFIIGVYAPTTLRIHRTMQRDHISRDEVLQRMKNQIDEDIKMRLCDAVIVNDDQHAVLPQVLQLHQKLISISQARP